MIAISDKGKVLMGSFRKFTIGIRLRQFNLTQDDVREIAAMNDRDLCATIRQLDARCNRLPIIPLDSDETGA